MNPWMQEQQEDSLELRKHAKEALDRFKAAPVRSIGIVLARTVKVAFLIVTGVLLALSKLGSSPRPGQEDELFKSVHPYDPNGSGDYADLSSTKR